MRRRYQYFYQKILLILIIPMLWQSPAQSIEQVAFNTKGSVLKLSDLKGKVVYVDFWASWCKPCRKSFPWMNNLQKQFAKQGLKIIAVNVDKDQSLVEKFLKMYPADFTVAYDPDGSLASKLKVKGMPSSFIFDRNGKLITSHVGFRKKDINMLEDKIKTVISLK